jgi:catechol 2,3-dioxygenase-like lactoylglutathione lyase family enzyme
MSRVQLALNVSDLDAAVDFYTRLFGAEPAKLRSGYANFVIRDPPLKLVLLENTRARERGIAGALNHLGVEVESTAEVASAQSRLAGRGLSVATEDNVTCCYARQDKVLVEDPDSRPWEIYTVIADAEMSAGALRTVAAPGEQCCAELSDPVDGV